MNSYAIKARPLQILPPTLLTPAAEVNMDFDCRGRSQLTVYTYNTAGTATGNNDVLPVRLAPISTTGVVSPGALPMNSLIGPQTGRTGGSAFAATQYDVSGVPRVRLIVKNGNATNDLTITAEGYLE